MLFMDGPWFNQSSFVWIEGSKFKDGAETSCPLVLTVWLMVPVLSRFLFFYALLLYVSFWFYPSTFKIVTKSVSVITKQLFWVLPLVRCIVGITSAPLKGQWDLLQWRETIYTTEYAITSLSVDTTTMFNVVFRIRSFVRDVFVFFK